MTHESLLEKIEVFIAEFCDEIKCTSCSPWKALRALVELHQPIYTFVADSDKSVPLCIQCRDGDFIADYPCTTIQTIERELG